MPSYSVTEPHPTALPNHYIHTGRGGAGNMIKSSLLSKSSQAQSLHKTTSNGSSQNPSAKTSTGRGGAGNIHPLSELPHYSLDDEMDAQVGRENHHEVWHVGRGGAGNWTSRKPEGSKRKSSGESSDSDASSPSGFFGRLSGAFERH